MEPHKIKKLILYTPHEKQLEFHKSKARFRVVSFGRQAGKSTACNNELLKRAWENPGSVVWYISPTYDSARIMFRRACSALMPCRGALAGDPNKSELCISFINGSSIFYKSGEVLENLRSETLNGVIIDEVRNQHQDLWPMVIRPMLTTTGGWAAFISTPNGYDHFYDLYSHAEKDESKQWEAFTAPSTCNPLITEKELDDAKRTMSEAQFAQEYLAQFRDLTSGKAYVNFSTDNLRMTSPFTNDGTLVNPFLPISVGMDFNVTPMSWVLGQKKVDDFYFMDEIYIKGTHTQECAKVLVQKCIDLHPKIHEVGVVLAGDSSGKASKTSASGQTDYDIICQALDAAKIPWINVTPEANPPVKDRVNTMNSKLKSAAGTSHLWVHPTRCPHLKKDFERVVWKDGANGAILDQKTNPDLTHPSDGAGYLVMALSPLKYNTSTPIMRILQR